MIIRIFPLFFLSAFGSVAFAQTACPVGVAPGSATCGPSPGVEMQQPPPTPSGEWLKTWGAVASNKSGDIGLSSGRATKQDAEAVAIEKCEDWNTGHCKIDLSYRNQCVAGATATTGKGGAVSSAATVKLAESMALSNCSNQGSKNCKILFSECSKPVFRKY